jgi:hypothetical protein
MVLVRYSDISGWPEWKLQPPRPVAEPYLKCTVVKCVRQNKRSRQKSL